MLLLWFGWRVTKGQCDRQASGFLNIQNKLPFTGDVVRDPGNISDGEGVVVASPPVWKMSKCGVFCGPYFPVFGLNVGKYRPEKTPYLDNFYPVPSAVSK